MMNNNVWETKTIETSILNNVLEVLTKTNTAIFEELLQPHNVSYFMEAMRQSGFKCKYDIETDEITLLPLKVASIRHNENDTRVNIYFENSSLYYFWNEKYNLK